LQAEIDALLAENENLRENKERYKKALGETTKKLWEIIPGYLAPNVEEKPSFPVGPTRFKSCPSCGGFFIRVMNHAPVDNTELEWVADYGCGCGVRGPLRTGSREGCVTDARTAWNAMPRKEDADADHALAERVRILVGRRRILLDVDSLCLKRIDTVEDLLK
jgi:hypothetical protein